MADADLLAAITQSIAQNREYLRTQFEHFHAHPELSYQEVETTAKLRELLQTAGIEVLKSSLNTGLFARIEGAHAGPVVALRADIDALAVTEETNLSYASRNPGVMHACGHDFHITTMLGAALALQAVRAKLSGTYIILFQPAEESSLGALQVLETGVLDRVDAILGTHVSAGDPVGQIGIHAGAVTAAVDRFKIYLSGTGTHAAHPHQGNDLVLAAAALTQELQQIRARVFDPQEDAILSVTRISAGTTWNVLPDSAELEGTLRTVTAQSRLLGESVLRQIAAGIAQAHGVQAGVQWIAGPPATNNDAELVGVAWRTAEKLGFTPKDWSGTLGGEDFAFYQQRIPGVFVWVGSGEQGGKLHSPTFQGNPEIISETARFAAVTAVEIAAELAKK